MKCHQERTGPHAGGEEAFLERELFDAACGKESEEQNHACEALGECIDEHTRSFLWGISNNVLYMNWLIYVVVLGINIKGQMSKAEGQEVVQSGGMIVSSFRKVWDLRP